MKKQYRGWPFSFLLAMSLIFTFLPLNIQAEAESLPLWANDVDDHWAASAITTCYTYGIASGYGDGYYKPNDYITRAEFAAMINRAFGYNKLSLPELGYVAGDSPYNDITADKWFASDMETALAMGIFQGYGNGIVAPGEKITREQAAVILYRVLRLKPAAEATEGFADINDVSSWAYDAVLTMRQSGYIAGYSDNYFMPKKNITRGETAQLLLNVLGEIVDNNRDASGAEYQNITIRKPGVALHNAVIKGDLFITEGVGDGDVWLDSVHIDGRLLVAGGGQNSIHVREITVGDNVVVDKPSIVGEEPVRFRAINTNQTTVIFEGTAREIIVTEDVIIIIDNDGEKTVFNMFKPEDSTAKPTVMISNDAKVDKVTAFIPAEIKGSGDVGRIEAHTDGVVIDADIKVEPGKVEAEKGMEIKVGDESITGTGLTDPTPLPADPAPVFDPQLTAEATPSSEPTLQAVTEPTLPPGESGDEIGSAPGNTDTDPLSTPVTEPTPGTEPISESGQPPETATGSETTSEATSEPATEPTPEPAPTPLPGGNTSTTRYTVSFNTDGGTAIDNQTVTRGSRASKPLDPTKEGYIFSGWYKDDLCVTEWNFAVDSVTKNSVIYAKWTPRTYTLSLSTPTFVNITYGDGQPAAQSIVITSTGNTDATVSGITLTGTNAGSFTLEGTNNIEAISLGSSGTTFAVRPNAGLNAGTHSATVTLTYNDGAKTAVDISFTVEPKAVTITGLGASNKSYNGNTVATATGTAVISGKIASDDVTVIAGSASFADKNATDGKIVTFSGYALSGSDAGNYELSEQPDAVTANITPKSVSITVSGAKSKTYDGNASAEVAGTANIEGKVGNDDLTVTPGNATFADKNVADGKDVTFSGYALSGSDAGNYMLSEQPAAVTANIAPKAITITGFGAKSKTYDGNASAEVTGTANIEGKIGSDDLTVTPGSAVFADKNVATGIVVTFSGFTLGGNDAGNYTLSKQPDSVTANITPKPLTLAIGISAQPTKILTPINSERSDEFTVTIGGLEGTDKVAVNIVQNNYGLSVSNNTDKGSTGTLTLSYDGQAEVDSDDAVSVAVYVNNRNYTSNELDISVKIIDGQTGRPIPVTQGNIEAFNEYAASDGLDKHYVLTENVTLADPASTGGSNWTAIGGDGKPFTGSFDGGGHTIENLVINKPNGDNQGMFGKLGTDKVGNGGIVSDVTLENPSITGNNNIGGVVGSNDGGMVDNVTIEGGSIAGKDNVGGVVGENSVAVDENGKAIKDTNGNTIGGEVRNSGSAGNVTGTGNNVGGVAGSNDGGTVADCDAEGTVKGGSNVGGVVGNNSVAVDEGGNIIVGEVENSGSTGNVTGAGDNVGGVAGSNNGGTVTACDAAGTVNGGSNVGGVVGNNNVAVDKNGDAIKDTNGNIIGGEVKNSGSTGNVSGTGDNVGGVAGSNDSGNVSNSSAAGTVTGGNNVGGVVGNNDGGEVQSSVATGKVSGENNVGGVAGNNSGGTVKDSVALNPNVEASGGSSSGNAGSIVGNNTNGGTVEGNFAHNVVVNGNDDSSNALPKADLIAPDFWEKFFPSEEVPVFKIETDEYGNPIFDENGAPVYVQKLDQDGKPILDENGEPVYVQEVGLDGKPITETVIELPQTIVDEIVKALPANLSITVSETPDKTLTPLGGENTATFKVEVSGFKNDADANNVKLKIYPVNGLSFSGHDILGNATNGTKIFTVTVTYDDTKDFTDGYAKIEITELDVENSGAANNGNYNPYSGGAVTTSVSIIDGRAVDSAISVNKTNISAFNTYANTPNGLTRHYKLEEDVELTAVSSGSSNWTTIGDNYSNIDASRFTGSFDGQDFTISNLAITAVTNNQGMFGRIGTWGIVKNLKLANVTINCTANGDVGGLVGHNYGTIENCQVSGTVSNNGYVGGIVGVNNSTGKVFNSFSSAHVQSIKTTTDNGNVAGGIVGQNVGLIQSCHSTGSVIGRGSVTSGDTTVTGNNIGGIAGWNDGKVQDCYHTTGAVTGIGNYVGGVNGRNTSGSQTLNSHASGEVHGASYVGGVVGGNEIGTSDSNPILVQNCFFNGTVIGSVDNVGGVVGRNNSQAKGIETKVENCYSTGEISGRNNVGGVAGYNRTTGLNDNKPQDYIPPDAAKNTGGKSMVRNCYSTANITGTGQYTGGVVGFNYSSTNKEYALVENCYATGRVDGKTQVGGVVGRNNGGTVQNCVALNNDIIASDSGSNQVGRVVGRNAYADSISGGAQALNNYAWSGVSLSENGAPKTASPALNTTVTTDASDDGADMSSATGRAAWMTAGFTFNGSPWLWDGTGTYTPHLSEDDLHSWPTHTGFPKGEVSPVLPAGITGLDAIVSTATNSGSNGRLTPMPGEYTTTFTVKVSGFKDGDNANSITLVLANTPGFTFSGHDSGTVSNNVKTFTVTATLTDTTAFPNGTTTFFLNALEGVPADYMYISGKLSVNVNNIIDGQTATRAIPLTQGNIETFNTYANTENGLKRHYMLNQNVSLNGITWKPIGNYSKRFTGSFDGQNYTMDKLTFSSGGGLGLFYYIGAGGVVKNINLTNISITSNNGSHIGGIAAYNYGMIQNCSVTGTITGIDYIGGIVAENSGSRSSGSQLGLIENCYTNVKITSKAITNWPGGFCGGVAGSNKLRGVIRNCYSNGDVIAETGPYVGGIVGFGLYGTIEYCYATGKIKGFGHVGGIAGYADGWVEHCVALNPYVTTTDSPWYAPYRDTSRVVGDMGTDVNFDYLYSNKNMAVYSKGRTSGSIMKTIAVWNMNKKDREGANVKPGTKSDQYNNQSFWQNAGFNFSNVWEWDNASSLPKLRQPVRTAQLMSFAVPMEYATVTLSTKGDDMATVMLQNGTNSGMFPSGDTVAALALPSEGYAFAAWQDEYGNTVSLTHAYSFTATEDITLIAVFAACESLDDPLQDEVPESAVVTLAATEGGFISGDGVEYGTAFSRAFSVGDVVTATAIEDEGYEFTAWLDEQGNIVSTSNSYIFSVVGDTHLLAEFSKTEVLNEPTAEDPDPDVPAEDDAPTPAVVISLVATEGGQISFDGLTWDVALNGEFRIGDVITVIVRLNEGYVFTGWQDENGETVSHDPDYSFTISGDIVLIAVCEEDSVDAYVPASHPTTEPPEASAPESGEVVPYTNGNDSNLPSGNNVEEGLQGTTIWQNNNNKRNSSITNMSL